MDDELWRNKKLSSWGLSALKFQPTLVLNTLCRLPYQHGHHIRSYWVDIWRRFQYLSTSNLPKRSRYRSESLCRSKLMNCEVKWVLMILDMKIKHNSQQSWKREWLQKSWKQWWKKSVSVDYRFIWSKIWFFFCCFRIWQLDSHTLTQCVSFHLSHIKYTLGLFQCNNPIILLESSSYLQLNCNS